MRVMDDLFNQLAINNNETNKLNIEMENADNEQIDNENYNLENPLSLDLQYKQEIDAIETREELKKYYDLNKGKGEEFDKYITIRMEQIN